MIGEIISNYKVISVIGEGGMGTVYLGEHIYNHKKAAIKSLHKKFLTNKSIKGRFKDEATTLSRLSEIKHPNIVDIYDFLDTNDGMYLIMEYVNGVLLDDYIKKESGPIKEENAVKIMIGMLSGFAFAHNKGIFHRDVKPNNIIISRDFSVVKILDFGIAKNTNDDNRNLTKDGTQMGTVYYMSPEQVRGQKVDNRSDIYSLGVTFFQMITGLNPYEAITTEFEIYTKITQEDLPSAKTIYPYVSDKVVAVIKKATKKIPAHRYQNCEEMIADLRAKNISPTIIDPIPPHKISIEEPLKGGKTSTVLILILVIGFIMIISGAGYYFSQKSENPNPDPLSDSIPEYTPPIIPLEKTDTTNAEFNNQYGDIFIYTGKIKDEKANGQGTATYLNSDINGDVYEGYFKSNVREGYGVYTYANNATYKSVEGIYSNNLLNGEVTVTFKDGHIERAEYKDDTFIKWL